MGIAIIIILCCSSLILGMYIGYLYGFKRMSLHSKIQVALFSDKLIKTGKFTTQELVDMAMKSQEEYIELISKNQNQKNNT